MKYVVFMCRTIKILVSNWPRTWKFSQLITGKEDSCSWLFSPWWHVGHALRPIFMVWLVKICQVSSCRKFMQHLETCYFDSWSWQSFVSTCVVFNCLFLLDVQNEIHLLSRSPLLFVASLFIGFLVEKYITCQSRKYDFGRYCFQFSPCLKCKRVEKSEAILALLERVPGAASWMVSLSNYYIWCLFFISN